jgi:hypothetical protein
MRQFIILFILVGAFFYIDSGIAFADQPGFANSRITIDVHGGTYWTKGGEDQGTSASGEWSPDKKAYGYAGLFAITGYSSAYRTLKGWSTSLEVGVIKRSKVKFMPVSLVWHYDIASEGNTVIPRIGFGLSYFYPLEEVKSDSGQTLTIGTMEKFGATFSLGALFKVQEDVYLSFDAREGIFQLIFSKQYETTLIGGVVYAL